MAEPSALPVPIGGAPRLIPRGDARLARLAAAGDERAFAAIYERYHQELYRYCRAILSDPHEAQDALQNTMASALRALPGESRTVQLRPWLYRVARNESLSLLRRRRPVAESDEARLPAQPASDAAFEVKERLRTLVSDLAALPERQRSALVMRELSGLSHEEIAAALDVSPGAARQVVYEARIALHELEEGRAMECDRVRRAISEHDGRVLRGRKLRAHLRGCEGCSDFRAAIETRSADLDLIAPPLAGLAASGVLASILGAGATTVGAGTVGGLAAGIGGGAIGAKTLGLVAASAAIGIGAGTVGDIELPGLGSGSEPQRASEAPVERATPAAVEPAAGPQGAAPQDQDPGTGNAKGHKKHPGPPASAGAQGASGSAAGGASAVAPAGEDRPETPPGSTVASDRSNGQSATPTTGPPEHASQGPPPHANPGGASAEHGKPKK